MSANPAFASLFNPGSAAGQAVARLRETATQLQAEGMRGKDLTLDEWVTIVDIDRVLPETPPPGRMAPLLRASGRVASRAAEILARALAGNPLTTGEWHSLDTAAAFAQSACRLTRARAAGLSGVAFADLFMRIDAMRWSRWLYQVHADIDLTRREFLSTTDVITWGQDSRVTPIAMDSDGRAAVGITATDPLLYADTWGVESLAERLAAGTEVIL